MKKIVVIIEPEEEELDLPIEVVLDIVKGNVFIFPVVDDCEKAIMPEVQNIEIR